MKYLEIADFHYSPERKEESKKCFEKIIKEAEEADFLVFCGDLFDKNIYANDDLNTIVEWFKEIKKPCCGVCGTPGHESRSMYRMLEEVCGFVLMESGAEYGYRNGKIEKTRYKEIPEVLIYGLDEITKRNYMARHPEVKPNEAGEKINNLIKEMITGNLASARSRLPEVPAVLVVHGNITDAADRVTEENEAIKRADIVIKTEWIKEAGINRTSAGHIHQYIEFKKINGGYGGSPAWNWGSVDFVPAFNKVNIDGLNVSVSRIAYGTPERKKISEPLKKYDSNIAYWLEYNGDMSLNPALNGGHEWSRMTIPLEKETERRVNIAEVENKSLAEIAKIYDKNITESQREKLTEAEKMREEKNRNAKSVKVLSVEVENCKLFNGKKMQIDIRNIEGLTQIVGENGSGKSSVLAFLTPYPAIIGKDTESGRISAIKDFFKEESGKVVKYVELNGEVHEHIILLNKGKCECFLNIDKKPVLERSNFDTMLEMCEKLYGDMEEYIITSFYVQPLQGKSESGLMSAGGTEIRNIVQNIAGINREEEKKYCLEKVNEIEKEVEKVNIQVEMLKSEDFADDEIQLKIKMSDKAKLEKETEEQKEITEALKRVFTEKNALREENEKKKAEKEESEKRICVNFNRITELKKKIGEVDSLKEKLKANEEKRNAYNGYLEEYGKWQSAESEKQGILNQVNSLKNNYENLLNKKSNYEKEIELYNKPCPNCGYICEDNKKRIQEIKDKIAALEIKEPELDGLRKQYAVLMKIKKPESVEKPEEESEIRSEIEKCAEAEKEIVSLEKENELLEERIKACRVENIEVSKELDEYHAAENKLTLKNLELDTVKAECVRLNEKINTVKENLKKARRLEEENKERNAELSDWKYCADVLQANKIPAMELDAVLDTIDRLANDNIKEYRDGRYIFMTRTQTEGKAKLLDKFSIQLVDTLAGSVKNYNNFSVGEKSFLLAAYNEALVELRQARTGVYYSPVISDEQDAFIDKENHKEFYKMKKNKACMFVSHSPDVELLGFNQVNIKSLLTV